MKYPRIWIATHHGEWLFPELAAASDKEAPVDVLLFLASLNDDDLNVQLAENWNTPSWLLRRFADMSERLRAAVARNYAAPSDLLAEIYTTAGKRDTALRESLGANPNTPLKILRRLARSRDWMIRAKVAQNLSAPVKLLEQLAVDNPMHVAQNPNTPEHVLRDLATRKEDVRIRVATHSNTPVDILETMVTDNSGQVRTQLARNPNTPDAILERLTRDYDSTVANIALKVTYMKQEDTPESFGEHLREEGLA